MITPTDLLDFAEDSKIGGEAALRAGISRAYYAAFHAVQAAVSVMAGADDIGQNGCLKHGATLHALRTWRDKHPDRKARMQFGADALKAYNRLRVMKESRERADYACSHEVGMRDLTDAISRARVVVGFATKAAGRI